MRGSSRTASLPFLAAGLTAPLKHAVRKAA
jgi:hypothetical protein